MRKPKMISCLLQEISFIAITWNPESNCTWRKRNHFLFRWKLSTLPETHIRHWAYCWRQIDDHWNVAWERELSDASTRIHKIRSTVGKATRRMHMVREETYGETNNLSSWWCVARYVWNLCPMQRKRKQNKDGLSRNQSSTMPDNREEYSSLNQTTKNSSSQWQPLVESWKFRCQQQCLAKYR